jgi:hypothetical protein
MQNSVRLPTICSVLLAIVSTITAVSRCEAAGGDIEIRAVDHETGQPIAVRMHLKDQSGKPVQPPKVPFWKDHFVFDGKITLSLPPGNYTFEMERGPEYRLRTGYFTIQRGAADSKQVDMQRFVDMKKEGWWSGELHVHRPVEDIWTNGPPTTAACRK